MDISTRGITLVNLTPIWTGSSVGYQMAYLTPAQKTSLGLPKRNEYAIRIDGGQNAALVRCLGGFTAWKSNATIL